MVITPIFVFGQRFPGWLNTIRPLLDNIIFYLVNVLLIFVMPWSRDQGSYDLARELTYNLPTSFLKSEQTLSLLLSKLVITDLSPW